MIFFFSNYKIAYTNHLQILIKLYPDKPWDWHGISANPNITWDIISSHRDKPWDWFWISYNPNITWDIIQNNPDKPWNWNEISCNRFERNPTVKKRKIREQKDKSYIFGQLLNLNYIELPEVIGKLICDYSY